jgi:hypothetical protein
VPPQPRDFVSILSAVGLGVSLAATACGRSPQASHASQVQTASAAKPSPKQAARPGKNDGAVAKAAKARPAKPAKPAKPALGPLKTEAFAFERRCPLASGESSRVEAGFDIKLHMDWPTQAPNEPLLTALRASITKLLTGQSVPKMPPKAVLEAAFLVHCAKYRAEHADELAKVERGDAPAVQGANWHLDDTLTVKAEPKGLVRIHRGRDTYSGGAHGNTDEVVQTFVVATGKRLELDALLTEDGMTTLRARLIELAKTDEKLKEAVDEPDKVEPSDDFVLTDEGIDFLYDPYDIAAYAAGPQQISVAWADLPASLREDAPWRPGEGARAKPAADPATKE